MTGGIPNPGPVGPFVLFLQAIATNAPVTKFEVPGTAILAQHLPNALFDERTQGHPVASGEGLGFTSKLIGEFDSRFHGMGARVALYGSPC